MHNYVGFVPTVMTVLDLSTLFLYLFTPSLGIQCPCFINPFPYLLYRAFILSPRYFSTCPPLSPTLPDYPYFPSTLYPVLYPNLFTVPPPPRAHDLAREFSPLWLSRGGHVVAFYIFPFLSLRPWPKPLSLCQDFIRKKCGDCGKGREGKGALSIYAVIFSSTKQKATKGYFCHGQCDLYSYKSLCLLIGRFYLYFDLVNKLFVQLLKAIKRAPGWYYLRAWYRVDQKKVTFVLDQLETCGFLQGV